MPPALDSDRDFLLARLGAKFRLSSEEEAALRGMPLTVQDVAAGYEIAVEGERPTRCCAVIHGFLIRRVMLQDGGRQILSFHVPGDMPDLQSLHLDRMDHTLAALTAARLVFMPHPALNAIVLSFPRIAAILWRTTLVDAAVFRQWMVGLGRRQALGRIAHLLCELYMRLRAVGLARESSVAMPISQVALADALGLSAVHVNRSLKELRAQGVIRLGGGILAIVDFDGLARIGEFDPAYLHLGRELALAPG